MATALKVCLHFAQLTTTLKLSHF